MNERGTQRKVHTRDSGNARVQQRWVNDAIRVENYWHTIRRGAERRYDRTVATRHDVDEIRSSLSGHDGCRKLLTRLYVKNADSCWSVRHYLFLWGHS